MTVHVFTMETACRRHSDVRAVFHYFTVVARTVTAERGIGRVLISSPTPGVPPCAFMVFTDVPFGSVTVSLLAGICGSP
jgi:hypothetical protein